MQRLLYLLLFVTAASGCSRASLKTVAPPEPEPLVVHRAVETEQPVEAEVATVVEIPVVKGPTVSDLCEPVDNRRPYPTSAERKATKKLIRLTCDALGVDRNTCKYFTMVSLRESSYRWWVRHKMNGDAAAAVRAWMDASLTYGWDVLWSYPAQKREDLTAITMTARRGDANPYFPDVERWMTGGLGLGGVNVGYHLSKFDKTAPPEILCDPIINVIVQVTLARSAVDRYGASNLYEVQAVYAGRTYYNRKGRARPLSCATGCPSEIRGDEPKYAKQRARARHGDGMMRKRCQAFGIDCLTKPNLGRALRGRDVTPADRYEFAESIRGEPLLPFDTPPDLREVTPQVVDEFKVEPTS